jgi:hypothetical protein
MTFETIVTEMMPLLDSDRSPEVEALLEQEEQLRQLRIEFLTLDKIHMAAVHEFFVSIGELRQFVSVINSWPFLVGIRGTLDDDDYKVMAYRMPELDV